MRCFGVVSISIQGNWVSFSAEQVRKWIAEAFAKGGTYMIGRLANYWWQLVYVRKEVRG